MSKNNIIIALVVLCLVGVIWGSVENKKSASMEKQLIAMRAEAANTSVVAEGDIGEESGKALAAIKELKSQNKALLENVASLKEKLTESQGNAQAAEAIQAELDAKIAVVASLEEAVAAAKAELAVAKENISSLEDVKSTLANDVDKYNEKSQQLATEAEECELRILSLNKALEERGRLLVESGEELARTKLNMNVLLSKIAAQNKSLEILESTRVALETELAARSLIIDDLLSKDDAQAVQEVIVVEEVAPAEETPAN